jgi:hypothetical protein
MNFKKKNLITTDGISVGISVGNKKIVAEGYTDEMKRVILFFYYQRRKNYR